jgi:hypothetical protein
MWGVCYLRKPEFVPAKRQLFEAWNLSLTVLQLGTGRFFSYPEFDVPKHFGMIPFIEPNGVFIQRVCVTIFMNIDDDAAPTRETDVDC